MAETTELGTPAAWLHEHPNWPEDIARRAMLTRLSWMDLGDGWREAPLYRWGTDPAIATLIAERDRALSERETMQAMMEAAQTLMDKAIAERDRALAERDAMRAERDAAYRKGLEDAAALVDARMAEAWGMTEEESALFHAAIAIRDLANQEKPQGIPAGKEG